MSKRTLGSRCEYRSLAALSYSHAQCTPQRQKQCLLLQFNEERTSLGTGDLIKSSVSNCRVVRRRPVSLLTGPNRTDTILIMCDCCINHFPYQIIQWSVIVSASRLAVMAAETGLTEIFGCT